MVRARVIFPGPPRKKRESPPCPGEEVVLRPQGGAAAGQNPQVARQERRLGGPLSSRPLSPRPCKAATPKGSAFLFLKLLPSLRLLSPRRPCKAAAPKGPAFCLLNYYLMVCVCIFLSFFVLHQASTSETILSKINQSGVKSKSRKDGRAACVDLI